MTKRGEAYLTWPQRALFDAIGIRRQVLETDPYGNFLFTGYDYGTARNWARIGQLYLQDGMWQGQRILPTGWTKFVSTLAPAWKTPVYAGQGYLVPRIDGRILIGATMERVVLDYGWPFIVATTDRFQHR